MSRASGDGRTSGGSARADASTEESEATALVGELQRIFVLLDDGDRRALRTVGVTPTQFALLRALDDSEHGELTVSRIADVLLCTRGNAARLVRRLNDAGMVATRTEPRDHRLVVVTITGDGRRRLRAARARLEEANARRLAQLSSGDVAALRRLAAALAEGLASDLADDGP